LVKFEFLKVLPCKELPFPLGWTLEEEVAAFTELPNAHDQQPTKLKTNKVLIKTPRHMMLLCGCKLPVVRVYCHAHTDCKVQQRQSTILQMAMGSGAHRIDNDPKCT